MKIIGEKINGTLKKIREAVENRHAEYIRTIARQQAEAGAFWLDVNAGTSPDREPDDLIWLVETIQSVVETPLCLDSANPAALRQAVKSVHKPPMINSISMEADRIEGVLPLVSEHGCDVIALAMDNKGIPKGVEDRMAVIRRLLETTRAASVPDNRVYIDPLLTALATDIQSAQTVLTVMRQARAEFPEVRFTVGLSNISFGLPERTLINRAFLTLALAEGLDAAIMDPLNRRMMGTLYAATAVLGKDRFCLDYSKAYRAGKFGEKKA